ncbi:MAG: DUF6580 family putative transport protein [Sphingomicrobium sp.]
MTSTAARNIVILSAIAAAAALRLVPHPPNFTPIGAMALFSGAYLGRRGGIAFAAPLGALLLSDAILGFYSGMAVNYFAVALIVLLGNLALRQVAPLRLLGTALAASVVFFVVSNLGVWAGSGMYPLTAAGLAACFVAAVPFFQNTLAGDLFYSAVLFGGFALLERSLPQLRTAPVATSPLRR